MPEKQQHSYQVTEIAQLEECKQFKESLRPEMANNEVVKGTNLQKLFLLTRTNLLIKDSL